MPRVAIETPFLVPVAPPPFDRESRIVSHLPSPITVASIRCFREDYTRRSSAAMGAEQTGRYSTTMGISIPVRRGRRPDWFLLARHLVLPKLSVTDDMTGLGRTRTVR